MVSVWLQREDHFNIIINIIILTSIIHESPVVDSSRNDTGDRERRDEQETNQAVRNRRNIRLDNHKQARPNSVSREVRQRTKPPQLARSYKDYCSLSMIENLSKTILKDIIESVGPDWISRELICRIKWSLDKIAPPRVTQQMKHYASK